MSQKLAPWMATTALILAASLIFTPAGIASGDQPASSPVSRPAVRAPLQAREPSVSPEDTPTTQPSALAAFTVPAADEPATRPPVRAATEAASTHATPATVTTTQPASPAQTGPVSATRPGATPSPPPVAATEPPSVDIPQTTPGPEDEPIAQEEPDTDAEQADIVFQFDGIKASEIIRRFAQMADRPVLGNLDHPELQKEVTYWDSAPYTFDEAFDTLNLILEMHNHRLIQRGRYLKVVEMPKVRTQTNLVGLTDLDGARPGEVVTVLIPLSYLDAAEASKAVAPILTTPFGNTAAVAKGKGLMVTDTVENIGRIRKLLSQFETEPVGDQQLKSVKLENASAANVAQIVTRLFGGAQPRTTQRRTARNRSQQPQRTPTPAATAGRLIATADERTNTVLLLGPPDKIALAMDVIAKLDSPEGPAGGEVRIFKLKNANAVNLVPTIQGAVQKDRRDTTVKLSAEPTSNRLIVSAPVDVMKKVEQLIMELDQAADVEGGARVFELKVADAVQLAPVISSATRMPGGRRGRSSLSVTADPQTNSLVVVGPASEIQTVETLIEQLDRKRDSQAREVHVVRLTSGDARQISRSLTNILTQRNGRGRRGPSPESVRVEGESTTNTLIISCLPGDWQTIQEVLSELQAAAEMTGSAVTRLIPLKHAQASDLASTLNRMYSRRGRGRGEIPVTIAASAATNSLVISASGIVIEEIGELVKQVDVPGSQKIDPVVMIRLESADAATTVAKLQSMMPRRRIPGQEIFVQADEATNSILIRGPEAQRKALEDAIAQLDAATQSQAREMVTIRLDNASAQAMTIMIAQMYRGQSSRGTRGRRGIPTSALDESVVATASPDDQTLIIEAPKPKIKEIIALVTKLDTEPSQAERQLRTYHLPNSDATRLARTLTNLMVQRQPRRRPGVTTVVQPRFDADSGTNQLIVAATAEQFEEIEALIKQLQGAPTLTSQTQTYELKHARADEMVNLLRSMLGEDRRGGRRGVVAQVPVRVGSLTGSNSVVVQASPDKLALAEELILQFDTADATGQTVIEIVRLANARAETLAQAVRDSLGRSSRTRGARGQTAGVTVTAETNSNALLVRGPADDVAEVVEMIRELDSDSTSDQAQVRVYTLKNSDAGELAGALEDMFRDITGQGRRRRGTSTTVFSAAADERTNRLVVTTTSAHFALVEELLASLDQESEKPAKDVRYFWLDNAYATDVSMQIEAMFDSRPRSDRPIVEGDIFSNTLTVIAKPSDMKEIESVITKLDEPDMSIKVSVLPVTGIKAEEMAETIRRVYGQMTDSEILVTDKLPETAPAGEQFLPMPDVDESFPATVPATSPSAPTGAVSDEKMFDKPVTPPVTIAVDRQSNSLIVSATQKEFENIQELIWDLTRSMPEGEEEVHVVDVEHADPAFVAQIIDDLFNPKPVAQTQQRRTRQTNNRQRRQQEQQQRAQPAQIKKTVVVIADPRTRRLIIRAKPTDFELVQSLIDTLDQAATVLNVLRVFPLKNSNATEVARNLQEIFQTASQSTPQTSRRGRQTPQQIRTEAVRRMIELRGEKGVTKVDTSTTVSITANTQSNSVVVAAPAESMELITTIIEELDQSAANATIPVVRLYEVKHAEVSEMVSSLQATFAPTTTRGRPRQGARTEAPVTITGNEGARLIIISATAEKQKLIAELLTDLDNRHSRDAYLVKVYKIENADAQSLQAALMAALGSQQTGRGRPRNQATSTAGGLRISADRSSNSLVVRATETQHAEIAALIAEMDVVPGGQYPVRMIAISHADPSNLAQILNTMYGGTGGSQGGRRGRQASSSQVIIEPDPQAGALLVRADDDTFAKISEMVSKLDQAAEGSAPVVKLYAVRNIDVQTAVDSLQQVFAQTGAGARRGRGGRSSGTQQEIVFVADALRQMIVVSAPAEKHSLIAEAIKQIDEAVTGDDIVVKVYKLEYAEANSLASALNATLNATAVGGRRRTSTQGGRIGISSDRSSNSVIVRAPLSDHQLISQLIAEMDMPASAEDEETRVVQLSNGDAVEMASTISDLYKQRQAGAKAQRRTVEPLAVSADARANAIIITGSGKVLDQVTEWITELEQMSPPVGTMRLIELDFADPEEVKKAIDELFQGGSRVRRTTTPRRTNAASASASRSGRVESAVMQKQRSILVSASDSDYEAIQALAAKLDEAAKQAKQEAKVFGLTHVAPSQIATALNQLYSKMARAGVEEDKVSVTSLPRTKAVVVTAAKDKMTEVAQLIQQLDKPEITPDVDFRVYPLENVSPTKILPVLRNMIAQIQKTQPDEPISVEADERTRSIIVSARGEVFEQVEKIIKQLDEAKIGREQEVLILPLKKADAKNLADVLNEMLRPSSEGVVTPEARALQEQIRLLRVRSAISEDVPQLDLSKPIKIQADPAQSQGSNALIVTSTPDNLKAIRAIVEIMDTVPISEGVKVRLVHLKNADAESVMSILKEVFSQGKQLGGKQGTSVSGKAEPESVAGKALVNQLNVSADIRTNTLVMSGMEESLALAEIIIKDLDREDGKIITEVHVFQLNYASAERITPILQAVFAEGNPVPEAEGLRAHVSRLRTVLKGEHTATTALAKIRPALTIQADETTNMLVVAARSDIMPLIADVIMTMDIPGAGSLNSVRVFPLRNAEATRVQKIFEDLHSGPNQDLIDNRDKPTIAIDTRTNSLIVWTSEKTFELMQSLLVGIDADIPLDLSDVQIIPLTNAEAASLADTLQEMMDARVERQATLDDLSAEALKVVILADERSNSLIVAGSRENFAFVKALAEKLDGASQALSGRVQLYPLSKANAGTLSQTLTTLFDQRYQQARTQDIQRQKPIILPDLRTNSLLVVANTDDTAVLKSLLAKLDVELTDPAVQLVVIPVFHNDASVLSGMIEDLFQARLQSMTPSGQSPAPQDRVDVAYDALANVLVVSASKENIALVKGLLDKVDVEPPLRTGVVKMYPLRNSDAQRIATMLEGLFSDGLYKPGLVTSGNTQIIQAREKVAITFDVRTNVLIVSASKENFAVIDELVDTLDASSDFGLLGDVRLYQLNHASASEVGPILQDFFDSKRSAEQATGASGRSLPVTIIADPRTNTLLVAGSRESFNAMEKMIAKIDAENAPPATKFQTFKLKHATASKLQPVLEELFDQRIERGTTKNDVTIIADADANSLIVGAAADEMKLAKTLIGQLDVDPGDPANTVRAFSLVKADATQVVETIEQLYEAQGGTAEAGVVLSADERTNTVVVRGGPADMRRIASLIKLLDGDVGIITQINEIKTFKLEYADATELAQVLNDTLTQKPESLTGGSDNRESLLQMRLMKDGRESIVSATQQGVVITPEPRTNSLVVSAPVDYMPLLGDLIRELDLLGPPDGDIKVFRLVNADAERMGDLLTALFKLDQAGGAGESMVKYEMSGKSAILGSAEQKALSITVDVRTNSLIVGGTSQYIELVGSVIEQLDGCPQPNRVTEVYRLRNARAADIETALTSFLDQEYENLSDRLGTEGLGAAQRLLEREVSVVAVATEGEEDNANTLLISASPRYFETIMDLVKELDKPPLQVLIQVLLVEVQLDDSLDLGIDWSLQGSAGGSRVATGTDFGVEGEIASLGGFSVAVSGSDFNLFLRALRSQGRVEVLSRPQILASDNETATIDIGQEVPIVTNVRETEEGTLLSTITYRDVGILLEVTPRINPEGFVRLDVKPEISSISEETVSIAGESATVLDSRTAETTVTVQDGHTIVIGGLITNQTTELEDKVPLLGDIPGLGWLFKEIREVEDRRELLIILTPHVMATIEDTDRVTAEEVEGLSLLRRQERREDPVTKPYVDWLRGLGRENGGQEVQRDRDDSLPDIQGMLMDKPKPRQRSGPMLLELLPSRAKDYKEEPSDGLYSDSLPDADSFPDADLE